MKRSNDHSVLGRPLCVGRIKLYRSLWRHWKYRFHVANIRSCFHNAISWTCKDANSLEKMVPTRHLYPYRNYYQTYWHCRNLDTAFLSLAGTVTYPWWPTESQRRSSWTFFSFSMWRTAQQRFPQWWRQTGPTGLSAVLSERNSVACKKGDKEPGSSRKDCYRHLARKWTVFF